jgi:hypothetical protein
VQQVIETLVVLELYVILSWLVVPLIYARKIDRAQGIVLRRLRRHVVVRARPQSVGIQGAADHVRLFGQLAISVRIAIVATSWLDIVKLKFGVLTSGSAILQLELA